jgi:hypothetical protein
VVPQRCRYKCESAGAWPKQGEPVWNHSMKITAYVNNLQAGAGLSTEEEGEGRSGGWHLSGRERGYSSATPRFSPSGAIVLPIRK